MRQASLILMLSILIRIAFSPVYAQITMNIPNLVPASPNAASLGKYGETPVNLYTGIPQISVPVYTVKSGTLTLPISLSYHAGGIRIAEMASNVGLGWSLQAGGCITRTIMGLSDCEESLGYMVQSPMLSTYYQNPFLHESRYTMAKIAVGYYDGEPDVYNFNFGKWSGSFVYNQSTASFICTPISTLRITPFFQNNDIAYFEVKDPDGVMYKFEAIERTEIVVHVAGSSPTRQVPTSWYLTEIKDLKDGSSITLEYNYNQYYLTNLSYEARTEPVWGSGVNTISAITGWQQHDSVKILGARIAKINFKGGHVLFVYNTQQRCDLPGDYSLNRIEVANTTKTVSSTQMSYSYFYDNPDNRECTNAAQHKQRLKLDSVKVLNVNDNTSLPPYKFKYIGNNHFPSRFTYEQDEYGFWGDNGGGLSNSLIPPVTYNGVNYPGNLKLVNVEKTKAGILNEITYPTGGRTVFEYEHNTYPSTTSESSIEWLGGGTSVSSAYDPLCDAINIKEDTEVEFEINELVAPLVYIAYGGYDTREYLEATGHPAPEFSPYLYNKNDPAKTNLLYTQYFEYRPYSQTDQMYLPQGTYVIGIHFGIGGDCYTNQVINAVYSNLNFAATYGRPTTVTNWANVAAGGARIKQINTYAHENAQPLITRYNYNGDNGWSSGSTQYRSSYFYPGVTLNQSDNYIFFKRFSISSYPLIYTHGSLVGYGKVTEEKADYLGNVLGKTENYFTSLSEFGDEVNTDFPFTPAQKKDWKRGLLTRQKIFAGSGQEFNLVKEEANTYQAVNDVVAEEGSLGVKAGYYYDDGGISGVFEHQILSSPSDIIYPPPHCDRRLSAYYVRSGLMQLTRKTDTVYSDADAEKRLIQTTDLTYNPANLQPEEVTTTDSKGNNKKIQYHYSEDLIGANPALYNAFNEINAINIPLKSEEFTGTSLMRTVESNYQLIGLGNHLLLSSYTEAFRNAASRTVVTISKYDARGNILESVDKEGVVNAFVPGYDNDSYIAIVKNASYDNIAYTSFETSETGGWTATGLVLTGNGITGLRSFNGTVTKAVATGNYTVTLWTGVGNTCSVNGTTGTLLATAGAWQLLQWKLTGVSAVQVTGTKIDEVRLYPADAEMTTFTYDPLIGITSQCDMNNRITYYSYDGFNRLALVKDQDGRILKKNDYSYTIQSDGYVVYGNTFKSQVFTRSNCATDYTGSTVTYAVQANTFYAATQTAADALADADITANGQAHANLNGTCTMYTYHSTALSGDFYSNACPEPQQGTAYHVDVPTNMFTSYISQADANAKATAYAQQQANDYGGCLEMVNVNFSSYINDSYNFIITIVDSQTSETLYIYQGGPGYNLIGTLPAGYYTVYIDHAVWTGNMYHFGIGCDPDYYSYSHVAMVYLGTGCSDIYLY